MPQLDDTQVIGAPHEAIFVAGARVRRRFAVAGFVVAGLVTAAWLVFLLAGVIAALTA
jgi:hypothetical protein